MRILFCGLGGIGQRHLRNLRSLLGDELDVHAYRVRRNRSKLQDNLTIEPGADLETDYRITVHHELDTALAVAPDAVYVCNPSSMHTQIALAAAAAGCHLFIEKPVSSSLDQLAELQSLVREKGLVCYVGYNFRFHPGLSRVKELIDLHFFGNILSARAEIGEYLPAWHNYEDYRQMYAARADLGGGVILSQIHEMDLICWFFGLPKTILCRGGRLSNLEIDVEDTASSLMQYEGVKGRFPISLHQDFLQRPAVRTFAVIGDAGVARMDLIRNRLQIFGADGLIEEDVSFPGFQRNDMFLSQTRHFLDCVAKGASPRADLHAGIQSLHLALAAKESLVRGVEVTLGPFWQSCHLHPAE
jgi:predicted dehydrogenase